MDSHEQSNRPSWLIQEIFPFDSQFVEMPQGRIHFVDEGDGTPLLLLHPAPSTAFFYKCLMLHLKGNFRMIVPDFPGFGLSQARPDFATTLENLSEFVNDFVVALDLKNVVVLVFDSSGPVGLKATALNSERYHALIVADSFAFPLIGRLRLVQFFLRFVVASLPVRWLNRRFNLFPWLVSTVAVFRHPLTRADRIAFQRFFGEIAQRDRIIDWFREMGKNQPFLRLVEEGIRRDLANKDVLLIYGQFDPMRFLGAAQRFRRLFNCVQYVIVPREEHFPLLGSPERIATEILNWWNLLKTSK